MLQLTWPAFLRSGVWTRLRSLYASAFKGCEETIDYGVPCYKSDGKMVAGFASQKQYIALYGMNEVAQRYSKELTGCSVGRADPFP